MSGPTNLSLRGIVDWALALFSQLTHKHAGPDIETGTVDIARLPTTGTVSNDSTKVPTAAAVNAALASSGGGSSEILWTGSSSSVAVTITGLTTETASPALVTIHFTDTNNYMETFSLWDAGSTLGGAAGQYRIRNWGGENADRPHYDRYISVSKSGDGWTFTANVTMKKIVLHRL